MVVNACNAAFRELKATAVCNLYLLKSPKQPLALKVISAADFAIQVYSSWTVYLAWTSFRCAGLMYRYSRVTSPELKKLILLEASVYSSMKVTGLVVSQAALLALGLATPAAAALILGWGAVLASLSTYAHYRAKCLHLEQLANRAPA